MKFHLIVLALFLIGCSESKNFETEEYSDNASNQDLAQQDELPDGNIPGSDSSTDDAQPTDEKEEEDDSTESETIDTTTPNVPSTPIGPDLIKISLSEIPKKLTPLYTENYASRTYSYPQYELADDAILAADAVGSGAETSGTNTQEAGVDEADRVKVHQDHLYLARQDDGVVDIYQLQDAQHSPRGKLDVDEQPLEGLYIANNQLTALSGSTNFGTYQWAMPEIMFDDVAVGGYVARSEDFKVYQYDLTTPDQPTKRHQITFDGQLLSSRMINGELILAMTYNPVLPNLRYYPDTEADLAYNKAIIANTPAETWLPQYKLDDTDQGSYLNPEGCYTTGYDGTYPTIISLIKVRFDDTPSISSNCFIGEAETLYASTESAYLATTQYSYSDTADWAANITTDVHKFNLQDLAYRGSAAVPGQLPDYSSMRPFALSEHNETLRMVTYTGDSTDSPASIHALTEMMGSLQRINTLPNSTYPSPIGKAGERIYAIRMLGDRGYVVTFRATDPLYVLDLTDPTNMRVAGELEITGFSDYLHIINDRYLLGVGHDAIADSESNDFRGAWTQGVKLSVFDVADPSNPMEVSATVIGKRGTRTEVSSNHHAFSALQIGNNLRVSIPIWLAEEPPEYGNITQSTWYSWSQDQMSRFEINTVTGAILTKTPIVTNKEESHEGSRSVLTSTAGHYIHRNGLISAPW